MRPQLHAVIEEAYEVFSDYRVRHSLSVCHCNCCMTEENERELLKTPLRDIPASLLAEYTNSAHAWDDGPDAFQHPACGSRSRACANAPADAPRTSGSGPLMQVLFSNRSARHRERRRARH